MYVRVLTALYPLRSPEFPVDLAGMRQKVGTNLSFFGTINPTGSGDHPDAIGKDAWTDRVEAEKSVERWLSEYPSTFITITGPPGSGKASLASRVLTHQNK